MGTLDEEQLLDLENILSKVDEELKREKGMKGEPKEERKENVEEQKDGDAKARESMIKVLIRDNEVVASPKLNP